MIKVMNFFFNFFIKKRQCGTCITHRHSRIVSYTLCQSMGAMVLRTGGQIGELLYDYLKILSLYGWSCRHRVQKKKILPVSEKEPKHRVAYVSSQYL